MTGPREIDPESRARLAALAAEWVGLAGLAEGCVHPGGEPIDPDPDLAADVEADIKALIRKFPGVAFAFCGVAFWLDGATVSYRRLIVLD